MKPISRRTCLKHLSFAAAAVPAAFHSFASEPESQHIPTESQSAAMAAVAQALMSKYNAPGLSVAIARHGRIVYQGGFGLANKSTGEPVTPAHLFRIASLSKPITSVAIYSLIEQDRIKLEDLVFGARGLLRFDYGQNLPERVSRITIHHLLTHTCGGWDNSGMDPMFHRPDWNHGELIAWTLREQPLQNEPGSHYAYSNFGYCLLGRVIEKITGQTYAEFVQQNVLAKCGAKNARIGGSTLSQRAPEEVVYYGQEGSGTNPYNMNVTRMDSHGGWIVSPSDLVQFAMHVDGFQTTPNILRPDSLKTMTTGTVANPHYGSGWSVNSVPNWWHTGSLPGSLTIMVRTASGLCWAALTNTRAEGLNLDEMMWKMVGCVPEWKA